MPSTEQVLQLLGQVELFEGLSKGDLSKIHGLSKELTFDAGQNVITQKGKGGRFYLVVEGQAAICINDEEEKPIRVGAYFGEMSLHRRRAPLGDGAGDHTAAHPDGRVVQLPTPAARAPDDHLQAARGAQPSSA